MKMNIILRSLFRNRWITSVIIISLAIGLASINPIIFYINKELRTDNFQVNVNRIYLLKCDDPFNKGSKMLACRLGAAEYMKENYSQVEDYCRIKNEVVQKVMADDHSYYNNPVLYEVTANFFSFFTYKLLTNNPYSVLETNHDVAISEDLAKEYFGTSLPVGKIITLTIEDIKSDFIIKGVFSKPSTNSHLSFDMVTLKNESESYAFLLLKSKTDPLALEKVFTKDKEKIPNINAGTPGKYYLENLKQAYFDTTINTTLGPVRDKNDIWLALIIGILILCIASFNFLGLINNELWDKTYEFNIRRTNGASKFSLISTFLLENLILIMISFTISLLLLLVIIPIFNSFSNSDLTFRLIFHKEELFFMLSVLAFLLLITLFFSYTKIRFHLISSISKLRVNNKEKIIQIPIFNILQLTVSLVLLVCSIVIIRQIKYVKEKDIGLNKDVIEIKLPYEYSGKTMSFKEEILQNPDVDLVSVTTASPLQDHWSVLNQYIKDGELKQYTPAIFSGDENYISSLDIRLLDGRNFSGNIYSDEHNCLINESLAKIFPDQNLIGKKLPGDNDMTVIGVIKDFNYLSLYKIIEPCIITFRKDGNHLLVKGPASKASIIRKAIKDTWQKLVPDYPLNIELVKDRYNWFHRESTNFAKLIESCCFISLFLSMIGLFAISFNSTRKRIKEIAIHKINGATILEILFLLNKNFFRWIVIAFIIAVPISWYSMHKWLEGYAYRTSLSYWYFVLAGILALAITIFTVSWQSWNAAITNPIEALRYE